jgi:hypothetical protein
VYGRGDGLSSPGSTGAMMSTRARTSRRPSHTRRARVPTIADVARYISLSGGGAAQKWPRPPDKSGNDDGMENSY